MTDVKGEFRYKSEWCYVSSILFFVGWIIAIWSHVGYIVIICSIPFLIFFAEVQGRFAANETMVQFLSLGRKEIINFKDIKKATIKNEQEQPLRLGAYYEITLEIISSEKTYCYTAKFEPEINTTTDLSVAFSEQYNNTPFVLLYNYINERISNKADEKPTE